MPEFPPSLPLEDLLLFPLGGRAHSADSDADSLKGDYADLRGKTPEQQNSLSRSIYAWNESRTYSDSQSSSSYQQQGPSERLSSHVATLPRRFANPQTATSPRASLVKTNGVLRLPNHSSPETSTATSTGLLADLSPIRRAGPSPGLYSVLADDAYYRGERGAERLTQEMEQLRLRAERNEQDAYADSRGLQPLQPPNPQMYSPKTNERWNGVYEERPREAVEEVTQWNPARTAASTRLFADSISSGRRRHEEKALAPQKSSPTKPVVIDSAEKSPPKSEEVNGDKKDGEEKEAEAKTEEGRGEPSVLEQVSAVVGSEGGVLHCPVSKVELRIPAGAIAEGEKHEIYVKVCEEEGSQAVDRAAGETLLSPLVMCGPHGLHFLRPVELRLPHNESRVDAASLAVKTGGEKADSWKQVAVPADEGAFLSVPIEHF